eukprot:gene2692-14905_t
MDPICCSQMPNIREQARLIVVSMTRKPSRVSGGKVRNLPTRIDAGGRWREEDGVLDLKRPNTAIACKLSSTAVAGLSIVASTVSTARRDQLAASLAIGKAIVCHQVILFLTPQPAHGEVKVLIAQLKAAMPSPPPRELDGWEKQYEEYVSIELEIAAVLHGPNSVLSDQRTAVLHGPNSVLSDQHAAAESRGISDTSENRHTAWPDPRVAPYTTSRRLHFDTPSQLGSPRGRSFHPASPHSRPASPPSPSRRRTQLDPSDQSLGPAQHQPKVPPPYAQILKREEELREKEAHTSGKRSFLSPPHLPLGRRLQSPSGRKHPQALAAAGDPQHPQDRQDRWDQQEQALSRKPAASPSRSSPDINTRLQARKSSSPDPMRSQEGERSGSPLPPYGGRSQVPLLGPKGLFHSGRGSPVRQAHHSKQQQLQAAAQQQHSHNTALHATAQQQQRPTSNNSSPLDRGPFDLGPTLQRSQVQLQPSSMGANQQGSQVQLQPSSVGAKQQGSQLQLQPSPVGAKQQGSQVIPQPSFLQSSSQLRSSTRRLSPESGSQVLQLELARK